MTDLVQHLRHTVLETLRPLLAGRATVLLGFPTHPNVGDSAIWLGELAALAALGAPPPRYTCDLDTFRADDLARRLPDGIVLLHGGGNLGDLWPAHQRFREAVLAALPGYPIVQLPQTIAFESREALDRARSAIDAHPRLTLLARDGASLALARREFSVPSLSCPDMAFALGPQPRPRASEVDVVCLARTDHEAQPDRPWARSAEDWLVEPWSPLAAWCRWLTVRSARHPRIASRLRGALSATYGPLARARVRRGLALLSRGRTVVTDRLHGHILCLLLGIPHVLRDTRHGKLRHFYDAWTSGSPLARWSDESEATACA